jgi:hypothetical protein
MGEAIYQVDLRSLKQVIPVLPVTEDTLMLLQRVPGNWLSEEERAEGVRLERFDSATNFDQWEQGRIFNAEFELRWEQVDGTFHAVYCGDKKEPPGFAEVKEIDLAALTTKQRSYFLWGERVKEEDLPVIGQSPGTLVFLEFQVPRLLHYPVSPQAKRAKLKVLEYRDATGALVYYRFCGVERVP